MKRAPQDRRAFLALTAGATTLWFARPAMALAKATSLTSLTLSEAAARVRRREVSPVELTRACFDRLDPEVAQLTDAALETMRTIAVVSSDSVSVPQYSEIPKGLAAEALAFHAPLFREAAERYGPNLRKGLAHALKECVSGIEYVNARQALQAARMHAAELFQEIDLLVLPTWKRLPMTLEARHKAWPPVEEDFMQELWNTLSFNVLGLPAISVPCGYTKRGLPVGMQIVGRPFAETQVLSFAHAYEQARKRHSRKPRLG